MSFVSLSSFLCVCISVCPCVAWEITPDRGKAKALRKLVGRTVSCVKECDYSDFLIFDFFAEHNSHLILVIVAS